MYNKSPEVLLCYFLNCKHAGILLAQKIIDITLDKIDVLMTPNKKTLNLTKIIVTQILVIFAKTIMNSESQIYLLQFI